MNRSVENRNLTDEVEIEKAINLGEYIRNGASRALWLLLFILIAYYYITETLALYSLRKYRHLKRMYPQDSLGEPIPDAQKTMKNT